jgi:hypothetical protein
MSSNRLSLRKAFVVITGLNPRAPRDGAIGNSGRKSVPGDDPADGEGGGIDAPPGSYSKEDDDLAVDPWGRL